MKLWQKHDQINSEDLFEQFCIGRDPELDTVMAVAEIKGSLAHARMLCEQGLLSPDELNALEQSLNAMLLDAEVGQFKIEEGMEDIHSQVEYLLTKELGDCGKKIHSGRSRNDQSLLDIKLYLKSEIVEIADLIKVLFHELLSMAGQYEKVAMPGYTHFQTAMPSSFGLWLSAYAESLTEDLWQFQSVLKLCDKNPLGSGAGYGSSFPLNRQRTTELLGMNELHINSINAQMSRGKTEKWMAMAMSNLSATLSRFCYDVCLYNSQNFGFVRLSDKVSTGSSIMPHKRNPDVFELLRAHYNRLQVLPNELSALTINLPMGYHRDMQLSKEILFPAIAKFKQCLNVLSRALKEIEVNPHCIEEPKYDALYTVERVTEKVMQGMPFRDAYKVVGLEFESGKTMKQSDLEYTHEGSIGQLCLDKIEERFLQVFGEFRFKADKR